jgi:hypothetical protein
MTVLFLPAMEESPTAGGATSGVDDGALSQPVAFAAAFVSLIDGASPHPPDALNSSALDIGGADAVS